MPRPLFSNFSLLVSYPLLSISMEFGINRFLMKIFNTNNTLRYLSSRHVLCLSAFSFMCYLLWRIKERYVLRDDNRLIMGAHKQCFRFSICWSVSKPKRLKCNWYPDIIEKSPPNFGLICPIKIRRDGETSVSIFRVWPDILSPLYFWSPPLSRLIRFRD